MLPGIGIIKMNIEHAVQDFSTPQQLLRALLKLREAVETEGEKTFAHWRLTIKRPGFLASALNLAWSPSEMTSS